MRGWLAALLIGAALVLGFAAGWVIRDQRSPPVDLVERLEQQIETLRAELAALPQNDAMRLAVPYAYDVIQVVDRHLDDLPADFEPRSCRGGIALLGTNMRRPEGLLLASCRYGIRAGESFVMLTLPDGRILEVP